jgi:hypothetical protein
MGAKKASGTGCIRAKRRQDIISCAAWAFRRRFVDVDILASEQISWRNRGLARSLVFIDVSSRCTAYLGDIEGT